MEESTRHLFKKYLAGKCSDMEVKLLLGHFKLADKELLLNQLIVDALKAAEPSQVNVPDLDHRLNAIQKNINLYLQSDPVKTRIWWSEWIRITAAASILLMIGVGFYFYNSHSKRLSTVQGLGAESDIAAGGYKATLTLANGRQLFIDDQGQGKLTEQAGYSVTKAKDGKLIYKVVQGASGKDIVSTLEYNTLSTPKGGIYQLKLSDGTLVVLNSGSSIRFPATFANLAERKVELNGEAYFEIMHNARQPFKVISAGQVVEDIGTAFNINSYVDEPGTKTTLIEGSASVNATVLAAGQQAVLTKGNLQIKHADIQEVLAWKEGNFLFNGEKIESVMRKIAYWYNVDVVYLGKKPTADFRGKVSRSRKISAVLELLELTGSVHFKVEGRKVTVMN